MKKFEPHYRLVRVGAAQKIEKASRQQRTFCPTIPWIIVSIASNGSAGLDTDFDFAPQENNERTDRRNSAVQRRRRVHRRTRRNEQDVSSGGGRRMQRRADEERLAEIEHGIFASLSYQEVAESNLPHIPGRHVINLLLPLCMIARSSTTAILPIKRIHQDSARKVTQKSSEIKPARIAFRVTVPPTWSAACSLCPTSRLLFPPIPPQWRKQKPTCLIHCKTLGIVETDGLLMSSCPTFVLHPTRFHLVFTNSHLVFSLFLASRGGIFLCTICWAQQASRPHKKKTEQNEATKQYMRTRTRNESHDRHLFSHSLSLSL
jgi:hypothetical protein